MIFSGSLCFNLDPWQGVKEEELNSVLQRIGIAIAILIVIVIAIAIGIVPWRVGIACFHCNHVIT